MLDIETIKANGLCSGCGLCAGIVKGEDTPIVMRDTQEGYRRPEAVAAVPPDLALKIDTVCPGANIRHDPSRLEAEYHPVWGPVIASRLGWTTNSKLRRNASSGGGLSALLSHLLRTQEVDYVVQTAVSRQSPIRNATVTSRQSEEVYRAAGSRYAPSSPLEGLADCLDRPGRFAFVGKPCDVAGLRQLSRVDPRVDEKVAFMIAFMCAGVPSYRGTSALLEAMGVEKESAIVAFRYRGDGWPGYATAELADGRRFRLDYQTSWGGILNRHLQFRCKICPDGIGEFADVVCADGWHCDNEGNPVFDEQEGRSIILSRTEKGENLVRRAVASGDLECTPLALSQIRDMQPFQARRKGMVLPRLAAMALLGRRRPRFANLELVRNMRAIGVRAATRSMLGTLKRLLESRPQF